MRSPRARTSLVLVLLATPLALVPTPRSPEATAATGGSRPDVVVVMTDDQRFDALANCMPSYGAPDGPDSVPCMPNVRALLQAQGVTFAHSYVTTSLCCPSRSSFLTGLYAHNHGVLTNEKPIGGVVGFARHESSTLATWLHGVGYRTALIGKYLNGYYGPQTPPGWDDWHTVYGTSSSSYTHFKLVENGVVQEYSNTYHTTVLGQRAVQFIDSTPASQPLFLYFAPHAPHYPWQPAKGDGTAYAGQPPWRPPSYAEPDVSDKPPWWQALPVPDDTFRAARDKAQRRQLRTLIEVDRQVGNIAAALGPRLANTLFVFTSDNGLDWGEHRAFEGKECQYEECVRVPLVVRFDPLTGGAARVDSTHPARNVDLAPTILEAAGVEPVDGMDGRSLLPLLAGPPPTDWRTAVLGENYGSLHPLDKLVPPSNALIETFPGDASGGRFKYVESCDRADRTLPCAVVSTELYDEAADPYELCNLLSPEGCGPSPPVQLVQQLTNRLHALEVARPPTISVQPPPATSTSPVSVAFGGTGLTRFRCALDGGEPAPCDSPFTPAGQDHGHHVLTILGDGPRGTAEPGRAWWWISDRLPATPSFTETPGARSEPAVTFRFEDAEPDVSFRCSLDGADPDPCASPLGLQDLAIGQHVLSVFALDPDGNLSLPATYRWEVVPELTPPTLTMKLPAADELLRQRAVLGGWAGSDDSGIGRYELTEGAGLGGRPVLVQSSKATSFTRAAADSGTYCYQVTAYDTVGNSTIGPLRCAAVPLDDRGLSFTGPVTAELSAGSFDDTVTRLTGTGSASFTFTGRRCGVLFRMGPDMGKAAVSVDGGTGKLVDLYATTSRPVWWTAQFADVGFHTVQVAWTGHRSDASGGTDVALDGVAAISEAAPQPA
jgi:N-acetylglucosamine-6-sulfatase